jgi:hypothetical protein
MNEDDMELTFETLEMNFKTVISSVRAQPPYIFLFSYAGSLYIININSPDIIIKI